MGRATMQEKITAEAFYLSGKSLREIADATGRKRDTLCLWAKAGGWETKRKEIVDRAVAKAAISAQRLMEENLHILVEQRDALVKRLKRLQEKGELDMQAKDVVPGLIQTIAAIDKVLRPTDPILQVNVASSGPTAVQVVEGRPISEWTTEELRASLAKSDMGQSTTNGLRIGQGTAWGGMAGDASDAAPDGGPVALPGGRRNATAVPVVATVADPVIVPERVVPTGEDEEETEGEVKEGT